MNFLDFLFLFSVNVWNRSIDSVILTVLSDRKNIWWVSLCYIISDYNYKSNTRESNKRCSKRNGINKPLGMEGDTAYPYVNALVLDIPAALQLYISPIHCLLTHLRWYSSLVKLHLTTSRSPSRLYVAPGNGGMSTHPTTAEAFRQKRTRIRSSKPSSSLNLSQEVQYENLSSRLW